MTSGATYWGVPQMVLIWLSAIFLARPKSAIFTAGTSCSEAGRCSSRFSSFKSLWLMLLRSKYQTEHQLLQWLSQRYSVRWST